MLSLDFAVNSIASTDGQVMNDHESEKMSGTDTGHIIAWIVEQREAAIDGIFK